MLTGIGGAGIVLAGIGGAVVGSREIARVPR